MPPSALLLGVALQACPTASATPIARAGQSFLAYPGESIRLDGSASEAEAPAYRWVQIGGPRVPLSHPDTARPELYADLPGRYTFELTVRSGDTASAPDEVDVVVVDPEVGTRYARASGCTTLPATPSWLAGAILAGMGLLRRRRT